MAASTAVWSMPSGTASRTMRRDWRRISIPLQATAKPTPMAVAASSQFQPVNPTTSAAISTAAETAASVSRWITAALRLRSWPASAPNRRAENRFTATPMAAAQSTGPAFTSTGWNRRCTPSTSTTAEAIRMSTPLASEASWVLRPKP